MVWFMTKFLHSAATRELFKELLKSKMPHGRLLKPNAEKNVNSSHECRMQPFEKLMLGVREGKREAERKDSKTFSYNRG